MQALDEAVPHAQKKKVGWEIKKVETNFSSKSSAKSSAAKKSGTKTAAKKTASAKSSGTKSGWSKKKA
jgi:GTP-binding protein